MPSPIEEVYKSSLKFLAPLDSEKTYQVIASEAMRLVGGDYSSILLMNKRSFTRVYSSTPVLSKIKPRRKGYTYKVYKTRKSITLDVERIKNIHPEIKEANIKSDILVPLIYKNASIGVLSILSKKKKLNKNDQEILLLISPLASLAIKKAQLTDDLERALKARDLFISMASHELKTPITTVSTYTQLIKRKMKSNEELSLDWIDTLLNELKRLNKLVEDLLHINLIKSGKLNYHWEHLKIKEAAKRSLTNFLASHKERKVMFEDKTKGDETIIGDLNKLVEVLINLLDNAAKYSESDSTIGLAIEKNKKNIVIKVKDDGEGISEEDLPHVFEDFYKGQNNTKAGMGLGLFLIKRIVNDHKGKIHIKSRLNKGTIVEVSLPLAR